MSKASLTRSEGRWTQGTYLSRRPAQRRRTRELIETEEEREEKGERVTANSEQRNENRRVDQREESSDVLN